MLTKCSFFYEKPFLKNHKLQMVQIKLAFFILKIVVLAGNCKVQIGVFYEFTPSYFILFYNVDNEVFLHFFILLKL